MAWLFVAVVLMPIASLALGWALQRKREHPNVYGCSRCRTEVRSRWELKRCPVCMKPFDRAT